MAKQDKGKQAKKKGQANKSMQTSQVSTNLTPKGMVKDVDALYLGDKNWSHAINAINNSVDGDTGVIGNEPANLHCANAPYRIIGGIHQYGDKWIIFSTDNYSSEIGLFDDSQCEYTTLINDSCLNFNQDNLIVGAAKENFDCTWQIYWDDGMNPSRTLNLDNIPWIQVQTSAEGAACVTFDDTPILDCEKIRLAPWIDIPCIKLSKAPEGGQLNNGSYQIYLAYLVNDKQIGDYVGISNIQPIWSHENTSGSIDIKLSNLDTEFEYYKLVVAFAHEGSVVAKKLGVYSSQQTTINIDYINPSLADVNIQDLPRRGEAYEKSKGMYVINDYLIRSNPVEQFDFNYQPIANNIRAKWVSVKYPSDYYRNGGNKPTFLRDEQYAFFIRFIYNTGERSSSYHIPGRPGSALETGPVDATNQLDGSESYFEAYNTATSESASYDSVNTLTDDGGVIIGVGAMGYWQSTERYPITDPVRWNTNEHVPNGTVDLCGEFIRHHKMPDESLPTGECALSSVSGQYIHILGVHFENISPPLDNNGEVIANIQGFEILTGSRVGNKSIIAKGIIRNMMEYDSVDGDGEESDSTVAVKNYMANYPYNSLNEDPYLIRPGTGNSLGYLPFLETIAPADNWLTGQWTGLSGLNDIKTYHHAATGDIGSDGANRSLNTFSKEMFTFHSPETQFERVYLNARELRLYGDVSGIATGHFTKSEGHPQHKILKDWMAVIAIIAGVGYAIYQMKGKRTRTREGTSSYGTGEVGTMVYGTGYWAAPYPVAGVATSAVSTAGSWISTIAEGLGDYALEGGLNALTIIGAGGVGRIARLTVFKGAELGAAALSSGHIGPKSTLSYEGSKFSETPDIMGVLTGLTTFMSHTATGGQELIDLLLNLMSYQDYTWKYNSHGFFNTTSRIKNDEVHRFEIHKNMYIGSNLQNMDSTIRVNNMHRPGTVVLNTSEPVLHTQDGPGDNSKFIIGDLRGDTGGTCTWHTPGVPVRSRISALYAGLKFNIDNQYGQIDSIKQMPLRGCSLMFKDQLPDCDPTKPDPCPPIVATDLFSTLQPLFGGDNYINRYTEKTVMPFWWNFMNGEPDGTPFDYRRYTNIPFPRYWMNTEKFRLDEMTKIFSNFGSFHNNINEILPSGMYHLDQVVGGIPATNGLTGATGNDSIGEGVGQGSGTSPLDTEAGDVTCDCNFDGTLTVSNTASDDSIWTWSGACSTTIPVLFQDGTTGTVTAYLQASGECELDNTYDLGGHGLDDYDNWPDHGTGSVFDLNEVAGGAGGVFNGVGTGTIEGTYSHATNEVTVNQGDVDFVSTVINAPILIPVAGSDPPAVSQETMTVVGGFFTIDGSCGTFTSPAAVANLPVQDQSDSQTEYSMGVVESGSKFAVRDAFMYTHNNGVLDFFVESELNLAFRDRGEEDDKRHYDKFDFTDVDALFHADIIQAGNYYKYNKQLSNKYFQLQISASWGEIQPRYYDPLVAATCWVEYPKRLIYSLQASKEKRKDNWRVFLPDNYKDFKDRVTTIKEISQLGALMLFPTLSPRLFTGVDTIQTNTSKFTIGDGGLFNKEPQNVANSDISHEYGSCESNRSVTASPHGLFFVSQAQGKIFHYGGKGLDPISNQGMKWWFNNYLPSNLLAQFPGLEGCPIEDNPLTGIGCQAVYDPNNDIVYFSKKDYSVLPAMTDCVQYNACEGFVYNLTECEGLGGTFYCPPGWDTDLSTGECSQWQEYPATPVQGSCAADIVIVVDSSNSIVGNDNKEDVIDFLQSVVDGLLTNQDLSVEGAEPLRIGMVHFGAGRHSTTSALSTFNATLTNPNNASCSGQDTMFDTDEQLALTATPQDITCWIESCSSSVYSYAVSCEDDPMGTDIIAGVWAGMNLLYGANSRPDVAKRLIIIADGAHSTLGDGGGYYGVNSGGTATDDVHQNAGTVDPATPVVAIGNIDDSDGYEYNIIDSAATAWMQTNVINNTSVYSNQQTYFVGFDTAQAGGENTPTDNQKTYFDLYANTGNSYYLSFINNEDAVIAGIVESIINDVCPDIGFYCAGTDDCPPGDADGEDFCRCEVFMDPLELDQTLPIELTDETYFEDVSWTVSYDPKSKAWVSFHDWHPELSFNSINHFMTTKKLDTDELGCPPGYVLEDGLCCLDITIEEPAQIVDTTVRATVNLTDADVTTSTDDIDIAIIMGATIRFIQASGTTKAAQKAFVETLLGNDGTDGDDVTNLAVGMAAGNVQVGIAEWWGEASTDTTAWHTLQTLTDDVPDCITAAGGMTPTGANGHFDSAILAGNSILTGSSADRKVVIVITSSKDDLCGTSVLGGSSTYLDEDFDSGIEVIVVHIQAVGTQLDGCGEGTWEGYTRCLINDATTDTAVCNENHFEITTYIDDQNTAFTIDTILESLESVTCTCAGSTIPVPSTFPCLPSPNPAPQCMECLCPTDYVMGTGPCDNLDPPDCVLQTCTCNPPVPGATLTETGTCLDDDDPLMCSWDYTECVPPSDALGSIWKHNVRTDMFSNYYGVDFPWEVDLLQSSGQLVNTVRSVEYNLESYVYKNGGRDRFHLLEFNFDQAELYNTEQTSGLLNLVLSPKNNITDMLEYPIVNATDIDILYSKEEQKYRFNQFWDVTNERGEFTDLQEPIYITQLNGYIRDLNMDNINLDKEAFQRKKFRHYYNHIVLRRSVSGDAKMLLRLTNTKINLSPR
jgi:hypothetical protein